MSRDDLFELFFNGSEGDLRQGFDDFEVSFDLFENVSSFYFMNVLIARFDFERKTLNCRPFSLRLTSDCDYCSSQIDDYSLCVGIINDIMYHYVRDILKNK